MKYDFPAEIINRAESLIELCRDKNIRLSTIESCTGGLLSGCLTDIAGSSDVLDRGFVTYSNEAKHEEVGVSHQSLEQFGAVSDVVAKCDAAAEAALQDADCRSTGREAALLFASAWARHGLHYVEDKEQVEGRSAIEIDEHDPLRAVEAIVQLLCKAVRRDRAS